MSNPPQPSIVSRNRVMISVSLVHSPGKPLDPVGVADNIFKSVKTSRIIIPDFVAGHEFSAHTQCIPECEAEYGSL